MKLTPTVKWALIYASAALVAFTFKPFSRLFEWVVRPATDYSLKFSADVDYYPYPGTGYLYGTNAGYAVLLPARLHVERDPAGIVEHLVAELSWQQRTQSVVLKSWRVLGSAEDGLIYLPMPPPTNRTIAPLRTNQLRTNY